MAHNYQAAGDDVSNHFSRLVAPFLGGFSIAAAAQLATSTSPKEPFHEIALACLIAATGLLIGAFQLSIGSLYQENSLARPILSFAGLVAITAGLVALVFSETGISQPLLLWPAVLILVLGVIVPIWMRIGKQGPLDLVPPRR